MPEVAVALSGGVDSSVAAALLVEAGRDVVGVTMRLGLAEIAGQTCCGEHEVLLARRVCATLGIPHVVIDVAADFAASVVEPFCDAYARGSTPNPCVWCNERVKFGAFVERVRALGVSALATGHYARLVREADGVWLERAADLTKDQSYFLYRVPPDVLAFLEFPLGDLAKTSVRAIATARGLPTAERRESQEVCFASDHTTLVAARHPEALVPGPIRDLTGAVIGSHHGIARYTVGQRKGLNITGAHDGPYRVVRIDAAENALVVARDRPAASTTVMLEEPVWRRPGPAHVLAQVRYRARPIPAEAVPTSTGLEVRFASLAEPLAPGQSVVLYEEDRVVGGGYVPAG